VVAQARGLVQAVVVQAVHSLQLAALLAALRLVAAAAAVRLWATAASAAPRRLQEPLRLRVNTAQAVAAAVRTRLVEPVETGAF